MPTAAQLAAVIKQFDADGSNTLDRVEYTALATAMRREINPPDGLLHLRMRTFVTQLPEPEPVGLDSTAQPAADGPDKLDEPNEPNGADEPLGETEGCGTEGCGGLEVINN